MERLREESLRPIHVALTQQVLDLPREALREDPEALERSLGLIERVPPAGDDATRESQNPCSCEFAWYTCDAAGLRGSVAPLLTAARPASGCP